MAARRRYSTHRRIDVPEISGWLRLVESGEVPACDEQRLLCAHVRSVFASERLWVDRGRLAAYMGYERYFPFDLAPEERFLVALWLCTYSEDGMPRWSDLLAYVARGWGKTGFAGYCAFCLLSPANGIPNYDVDICATTEPQAKIGYDDLWRLFESDPDLWSQGFEWNRVELYCRSTGSRFKYWSGNSNSKDGMRSGAVFFDEVHAYENSDSMGVFTGGLGKKPEPRRLMTTTDGFVREGPLDDLKARAQAILRDGESDNGLLPFICKLDDIADAADEALWVKANPRLRTSPSLMAEYRREVAEWRGNPARHPEVPTKRFNLPEERRDLAVTTRERLMAASRPVDPARLRGMQCVAGIDYAKTTDMVGACLLFKDGDERLVVPHAWWCTRSADAGNVKAPLEEWAARGLLSIETGVEVSPDEVAAWIRETADGLGADLRCVAIDSYRFTLMRRALESIGMDPSGTRDEKQVWETRPSDVMRVQPVIESAFANHRIAWGDNPLMRWATNNATLVPAQNNNLTYGKVEPHSRKTDPFMALVHAMCVEGRIEGAPPVDLMAPLFF